MMKIPQNCFDIFFLIYVLNIIKTILDNFNIILHH